MNNRGNFKNEIIKTINQYLTKKEYGCFGNGKERALQYRDVINIMNDETEIVKKIYDDFLNNGKNSPLENSKKLRIRLGLELCAYLNIHPTVNIPTQKQIPIDKNKLAAMSFMNQNKKFPGLISSTETKIINREVYVSSVVGKISDEEAVNVMQNYLHNAHNQINDLYQSKQLSY